MRVEIGDEGVGTRVEGLRGDEGACEVGRVDGAAGVLGARFWDCLGRGGERIGVRIGRHGGGADKRNGG